MKGRIWELRSDMSVQCYGYSVNSNATKHWNDRGLCHRFNKPESGANFIFKWPHVIMFALSLHQTFS